MYLLNMSFVTSLSDDNSSFTQPSFLFDFVYLKWPNPIFSPIILPLYKLLLCLKLVSLEFTYDFGVLMTWFVVHCSYVTDLPISKFDYCFDISFVSPIHQYFL